MVADSEDGIAIAKGEALELEVYGRFGESAPILLPADKVKITADGFTVSGLVITPAEGTTGEKDVTVAVNGSTKAVSTTVKVTVAGA